MRSKAVLISALLLMGCAGPLVGREGRVTVALYETLQEADQACRRLAKRDPGPGRAFGGCMVRWAEGGYWYYQVHCVRDSAYCLAHEIRHIVEPEWHHD